MAGMSRSGSDRKRLGASAAWLFAGLATSPWAFAQTTGQAREGFEAAPPADMDQALIVTGSRIPDPDYAFSNPVTSTTGDAIQYSGVTNLTDFLSDIPALVGSSDTASTSGDSGFIGSTGLNLLNLRNLGTERTLVLVNGRRHVAGAPASADVDTNSIPIDLIERVDVLTGGASAIYGADGVSGVVNIITQDDFEGLRVRGQYGEPGEGDAEKAFLSATAGLDLDDGRGNIAVSFEGGHEGRLSSTDRAHTRRAARIVRNPNDFTPDDDPSIPDYVPMDDLRWFQSGPGGAVFTDFPYLTMGFEGADVPWDMGAVPEGIEGRTFQRGGSGTPTAGYGRDLLGEIDRFAVNLFAHYDLSDSIRFFTEQKFVVTEGLTFGQPTFDFFLFLSPDNPFIPQNIADAAASSGAPFLIMSRDNLDLGFRGEDVSRETYRGVWGIEGELADWIDYNVAYVYGEVDARTIAINNRLDDRFAAAIDVVDADPGPGVTPVCRSTLDPTAPSSDPNTMLRSAYFDAEDFPMPGSFTPGAGSGCVPLNLFGDGSPSPEAIAWVMTRSSQSDRNVQHVGTAYVVGETPGFRLQGGAVKFVLGGEWRRETSETTPAPEDQAGLTFNNVIPPSSGAYEVREGFGELQAPIFADIPFFADLTLNGAVRVSRYNTFGDTTTWNYGGVWSPVTDVTFRGTKARAVRVPNIGEMFSTESQTFAFIDDPCDQTRLNDGSPYRTANCLALLDGLDVADPAHYADPGAGVSVGGATGGNRDLNAETADTTTLGVIVRPRFVEGLTVSLDYYDIDLADAILTPHPQNIADQCVDTPTMDDYFCTMIYRASGGANAGQIIGFKTHPANVARFATAGVDFSVRYYLDPSRLGADRDLGTFSFNLIGNHLEKLEFVNLPGAEPDPAEGEAGAPEWQVTFDLAWRRGPLLLNYGYNYFSETDRFDNASLEDEPDLIDPQFFKFDARSTHDLQVRWEAPRGFTLYGGVNNMFDQQPDDFAESYPVSAVGRFFYLGFTTKVDSLTGAN
jgi:outer membrane receptor protein involved in Fe transport